MITVISNITYKVDMTVNPDAIPVTTLSSFSEKGSRFLSAFSNRIAEASMNLLENNPWGMQTSSFDRPVSVNRSASEPVRAERPRPPLTPSVTPSWGVELYGDEQMPSSAPALATTQSAPAIASGNAPKREFEQFLMTKVGIPAVIADTFVNNILPSNALQNVAINEANKTFTLTLDAGSHEGKINNVLEAGITLLNGSTVNMQQVIRGTYNAESRSVDFENGAFTVKGGWKLGYQTTSILGLQIVTVAGQDEIIIKTGVKNLPSAALTRFPNTFSHLSWS